MNCTDFRSWFHRLLRDGPPGTWPAEEYRRHLASCAACQLLLTLGEVEDTIGAHLARADLPLTRPAAPLIRHVRRKVVVRRLARSGAWLSVAAILVAALWTSGWLSGGRPEPTPTPLAGVQETRQALLEQYCRTLETPRFTFVLAYEVKVDGKVFALYRRASEADDQYAFAVSALCALADSPYRQAPVFYVSVADGERAEKALFQVMADREVLARVRESHAGASAVSFLRQFTIIYDMEGRVVPPEER